MTDPQFRRIVAARRDLAVTRPAHVGAPLNLRPKRQRRWWRFGR